MHRAIAYLITLMAFSVLPQRVSSYPSSESECRFRTKVMDREGKFIVPRSPNIIGNHVGGDACPPENDKKTVLAKASDTVAIGEQLQQPIGTVDLKNGRHVFTPVEWVLDHQRHGRYSEGLCHVTLEIPPDRHNQEAFITQSREIVLTLPTTIKACGDFHDGLASIVMEHADDQYHQSDQCVGFIDRTGTLVIPAVYELPRRWRHYNPVEQVAFHDDRVHVRRLGIDYYLDRSGTPIANFQGARCNDFCNGVAAVEVLVDAHGHEIDLSDKTHGYQNRFDYESAVCKMLSEKLRYLRNAEIIAIRFYEDGTTSPAITTNSAIPAEFLAKVRSIVHATKLPERGIFMANDRIYFDVFFQNGSVTCEPFHSRF